MAAWFISFLVWSDPRRRSPFLWRTGISGVVGRLESVKNTEIKTEINLKPAVRCNVSGKLLPEGKKKDQPLSDIKEILKSTLRRKIWWKTELGWLFLWGLLLRWEAQLSHRIYCISNIVKMPLTQCHFSHWHTHSLSVLPSFLIIPAPSAMWSFQKEAKITFWLERLTRCYIKKKGSAWCEMMWELKKSAFGRSRGEKFHLMISAFLDFPPCVVIVSHLAGCFILKQEVSVWSHLLPS